MRSRSSAPARCDLRAAPGARAGRAHLHYPAAGRRCGRWSAPRRCCAGTIRRAARYPAGRVHPARRAQRLHGAIEPWVLKTACADAEIAGSAMRWRRISSSPSTSAPHRCQRRASSPASRQTLDETGADPSQLTLELTEHVMLDDFQARERRHARAEGARRKLRARRFRHRLFVAVLSEAAADRRAQDRPLLRPRHRERRATARW